MQNDQVLAVNFQEIRLGTRPDRGDSYLRVFVVTLYIKTLIVLQNDTRGQAFRALTEMLVEIVLVQRAFWSFPDAMDLSAHT